MKIVIEINDEKLNKMIKSMSVVLFRSKYNEKDFEKIKSNIKNSTLHNFDQNLEDIIKEALENYYM